MWSKLLQDNENSMMLSKRKQTVLQSVSQTGKLTLKPFVWISNTKVQKKLNLNFVVNCPFRFLLETNIPFDSV